MKTQYPLLRSPLAALLAVSLSALPACREDHETQTAKLLGVTVSERDRVEARDLFAARCAPCHGANGGGDGAAAKALVPPPRNFHDGAWQSSVTDEQIAKIIRFGGPAVGKSPVMPANPDLVERGAIVAALTGRLRSLGE